MMTYDQAKLFECTRTGIGATYSEIKRLLGWNTERIASALKASVEDGYIDFDIMRNAMHFKATDKGKAAYEKWRDIPF